MDPGAQKYAPVAVLVKEVEQLLFLHLLGEIVKRRDTYAVVILYLGHDDIKLSEHDKLRLNLAIRVGVGAHFSGCLCGMRDACMHC